MKDFRPVVLEREYPDRDSHEGMPLRPVFGTLTIPDREPIKTVELPWLDNTNGISCIPEGIHRMKQRDFGRWASKLKKSCGHPYVVEVKVPYRSAILIHPVGYPEFQLQGCIGTLKHVSWQKREDLNDKHRSKYNKRIQRMLDENVPQHHFAQEFDAEQVAMPVNPDASYLCGQGIAVCSGSLTSYKIMFDYIDSYFQCNHRHYLEVKYKGADNGQKS